MLQELMALRRVDAPLLRPVRGRVLAQLTMSSSRTRHGSTSLLLPGRGVEEELEPELLLAQLLTLEVAKLQARNT